MKIRAIRMLAAAAVAGVGIASVVAPALAGDPKDHAHKEAAATTAAGKVGAPAPAWTAVDMDGKSHKLSDFKGKIVVLEWFNPGCPFVVSHYEAKTSLNTYGELSKGGDVVWLLVNSSAAGKEGNGADLNKGKAKAWGVNFPIINDEKGDIGKAYGAKTTPHIFIINKEGVLAYAGAIDNDNSIKGEKRGKPEYVNYVKQAVNQIRTGETVTPSETKSYGCSVKY